MRKIVHLRSPSSRFPRGREFAHAGKFGDIIYALPAVRSLGGGKLWLHDWACETLMEMTPAAVGVIRPLLLAQPYITEVNWCQQRPAAAVDLSAFRSRSNRFCAVATPDSASTAVLRSARTIGRGAMASR